MKKFLNKALMVLLVVIMAFSSVPLTNIADADFGSPFAITAEAAKKTIKLEKSKPTVYTGEKYTLKLLDKKGKKISAKKIKWTTANKKIATVDKNGVVKGVKAGKVKITATYKKKKYVATVTVKNSVKFKKSKVSVYIGEKYTLKLVDKKGKTISNDKIKWASADKKIATVSKKGVVNAKKAGKVKITATYKNIKYTATVTVKNLFSLNKNKFVFSNGDSGKKTVKVTYKGNNSIYYEIVSGKDVISCKWGEGWNKDTCDLYIYPESGSYGDARIKVYDKESPANCVYIDVTVESPYKIVIKNELPCIVSNYERADYYQSGEKMSSAKVLGVDYEISGTDTVILTVDFQAHSSYYDEGYFYVKYRVTDSEGYVVEFDRLMSDRMFIGDKGKKKIYLFDVAPGVYTIEFLDHFASN